MKINRFLLILILLLVFSCSEIDYGPAFVTITNNSDYNITRVRIGNLGTNIIVAEEIDNKLIAKGGSKTFEVSGKELSGKFIACVEAEDVSELMCTITFNLHESDKVFFTWGGDNSSLWR